MALLSAPTPQDSAAGEMAPAPPLSQGCHQHWGNCLPVVSVGLCLPLSFSLPLVSYQHHDESCALWYPWYLLVPPARPGALQQDPVLVTIPSLVLTQLGRWKTRLAVRLMWTNPFSLEGYMQMLPHVLHAAYTPGPKQLQQ